MVLLVTLCRCSSQIVKRRMTVHVIKVVKRRVSSILCTTSSNVCWYFSKKRCGMKNATYALLPALILLFMVVLCTLCHTNMHIGQPKQLCRRAIHHCASFLPAAFWKFFFNCYNSYEVPFPVGMRCQMLFLHPIKGILSYPVPQALLNLGMFEFNLVWEHVCTCLLVHVCVCSCFLCHFFLCVQG